MKIPEDKLPDRITDREVKRLNYFNTQFLQEADFQDEQAYHIRLRRAHNRAIYGWGIIEGLSIFKKGDKEISIEPGIAVDRLGREIILIENGITNSYELSAFLANNVVFLTISYDNNMDENDRNQSGDTTKFTRITERPKLEATTTKPNEDGSIIILGKVTLDAIGNIDVNNIDSSELSGRHQIARSQRSPIVGIVDNGTEIFAPDGNPSNWIIFLSLNQITSTAAFILGYDISSESTQNGWKIKCVGITAADGSTTVSGKAHYLILRK
jgi:hypothetical protein